MQIIRGAESYKLSGCDVTVCFSADQKVLRLLQLTDMQIIDASQQRRPDRLSPAEQIAWQPDTVAHNFEDHVSSLIAQCNPHLIFITGDMVYGSFDDNGSVFERFCRFMDSFGVPWAPVFGNHDNETALGVDWQCARLEQSEYCLFCRGTVSGNSNYTLGIKQGNALIRTFYMLDSHGCLMHSGLYEDQLEWMKECSLRIGDAPSFVCMHHPVGEYYEAERAKGYADEDHLSYVIGVGNKAKDGDFGSKLENYKRIKTLDVPGFYDLLKACHTEAVFAGHFHSINTCILYRGIRWVFGLKTGQYDYHTPGQIGGTLVTLAEGSFDIKHLPSLVPYAPFPRDSIIFKNFLTAPQED